jgi:hypothetical protein
MGKTRHRFIDSLAPARSPLAGFLLCKTPFVRSQRPQVPCDAEAGHWCQKSVGWSLTILNGDSCNSPLRREIVLRQAGSAVLRWPGETAILNTSNIEHRTSNIEHRTSNIEHRTSNIEHRTSNIQHRTSNIQHRTSNIEHSTLNSRTRTRTNRETGPRATRPSESAACQPASGFVLIHPCSISRRSIVP